MMAQSAGAAGVMVAALVAVVVAAGAGQVGAAPCSADYVRTAAGTLLQSLFSEDRAFTAPSTLHDTFLLSTASTLAAFANSRSGRVSPAKKEIYTLLDTQVAESGRVPEYTCIDSCTEYVQGTLFPGEQYWKSNSSGIASIPFHASAAQSIHAMSSDSTFVNDVYPKLLKYHEYLHTQRVDCNGNVVVMHPWETFLGEDSSLWTAALGSVIDHVDDVGFTVHIPTSVKTLPNYPGDTVFTAEMFLVECMTEHGSELEGYVANCEAPFAMLDAEYLSVLYQADMDLLRFSHAAGDDASQSKIQAWIDQDAKTLRELFSTSRNLYVNKLVTFPEGDLSSCEYSTLDFHAAPEQVSYATPLFTGLASATQASAISDRLMSPSTGFLCTDIPYSAETCGAAQDHAIWVQHNILLAAGLQLTDQTDFASWVQNKTFTLVCNMTGTVGDTQAHGSVLPRVFDGATGRTMPDMYGEQSAIGAAVIVLFDNLLITEDDDHEPPVGHDVIFALIIVALSMAFAIGAMCFLFSYNLLRNLKDTEAHPALADVRPTQAANNTYDEFTSTPAAGSYSSRSPPASSTDYRQFGAPDRMASRAESTTEQKGWWGIIAPYTQYLRVW